MDEDAYIDDRDLINDAEIICLDWPAMVKKPKIGIVQDYGPYPRWTKYRRFLDNNAIPFDFYNIHAHDWIEKANEFDIIIGVPSNELSCLQEIREKYYVLETFLDKACYPSHKHVLIYEDKKMESFISKIKGFPFARTYISYNKEDALQLVGKIKFPVISKIIPGSGSVGVEFVRNQSQARRIVGQAFSRNGRKIQVVYFRQKDYVYFQDYIPNDGYDIRVIVVGAWIFGYYRKVLQGDFRASGMGQVEKRELPEEAIRIAFEINKVIKSPQLVVDMVHDLDDKYNIIEYSPICQMETPEQLHVKHVPGVYIIEDNGSIHFEKGRFWVHELALREFFLNDYLLKRSNTDKQAEDPRPQ